MKPKPKGHSGRIYFYQAFKGHNVKPLYDPDPIERICNKCRKPFMSTGDRQCEPCNEQNSKYSARECCRGSGALIDLATVRNTKAVGNV